MAWSLFVAVGIFIVLAPFAAMWLALRFSPLVRSSHRPTWKRSSMIVLALMIVGVVAALIWPIWLALPHFQYTPYVYVGLVFLWLPTLFICVLLRPTGVTFGAVVTVLIIGYVLAVLVLALVGPRVSVWAFEPQDCSQQTAVEGQGHFICKHNFAFGVASTYDQYTLDGPQGWPFVRLISAEHGGYP